METWQDIPGFEGVYQVSDLGRIKSIERFIDEYPYRRTVKERILKAGTNTSNYLAVGLYKNGKAKTTLVSRLVAIQFVPNPLNLPEVNHLDFDKTNNRADNLEWATGKKNIEHATQNKRQRARKVVSPDGEIFHSVKDAAAVAGINPKRFYHILTGNLKTKTAFKFL